jgi:hypothetical protein
VLWQLLEALSAAGHAIRLVVPGNSNDVEPTTMHQLLRVCTPHLVSVWPRSWARSAMSAAVRNRALSVSRHRYSAVQEVIGRLLDSWQPDLVHVEHVHAWANCAPLRRSKLPLVLRMPNLESSLWQQAARASLSARGRGLEALRLRADERLAVRQAAAVVTLTEADAQALRQIARPLHAPKIRCISPAFVAGHTVAPMSAVARPTVVIPGNSSGWPGEPSNRWFVEQVWPRLRAQRPDVDIHVYGGEPLRSTGVHWHAASAQLTDTFAAGAILAQPALLGSGIDVRILDAWARSMPVVATPAAAAGLMVQDGEQLLLAHGADQFTRAVLRLLDDALLREHLVRGGRAYLHQHHDPQTQNQALLDCYQSLLSNPLSAVAAN